MSDKIPGGSPTSKRSDISVAQVDEPATKKVKSGQNIETRPATEKEIKKKIDRLKSDTTPLPKNTRLSTSRSQAVKMPDWMKGHRPTMPEIMRKSQEQIPLPSTDEEWAELEKELKQVEFEVFGTRSR